MQTALGSPIYWQINKKFQFTKNINMTKPLAKLVKLFTATVIIASLKNVA
jgi:hypothetical protein